MSLIASLNVVWKAHTGSQVLALSCPAHIILYAGSRGGGKTDTQLMRFRARVGLGYGKFWRGIIFDREYKNLDDMVAKTLRWFPEFFDGAKFLSSKSDYKWVWPTGEELLFRVIKKAKDYWLYHGQEFPFIGWNELTKYPDQELFNSMMSCNRSSFLPANYPQKDNHGKTYLLPNIPLEIFATSNPFGPGHNWVKKFFIDAAPMGRIHKEEVRAFDPRTQEMTTVVKTKCHIFSSFIENRHLDPSYVADLMAIDDPNKKEAWLKGSWDITSGGMFDDLWNSKIHKITPFIIPHTWKIDRSFDWGSTKPFSVGWWARSDGCDVVLPNGKVMSTKRGDLFRIAEWYGSTGKPNEGLKYLAAEVTVGIIKRELAMGIRHRVVPGPADNSIWDVENGNCIAADMAKPVRISGKMHKGVEWARSDKSAGSRKNGWLRVRTYLKAALPDKDNPGPREKPAMYVFDTCKSFLELFPSLPRDEEDLEDIDTDVEDHIGDEVRYRILHEAMGAGLGTTTGT